MKVRSRKNLRWSTERVLAEIHQWKDKGEPLYANHVRLNFQELLAASIRYFGSWQAALDRPESRMSMSANIESGPRK